MGANAQTTVPSFSTGAVLTADQQNQSARTGVPVFATTVTRDAGFGGTGEKTLAEGQLAYVEGTGLQTYNGTNWITWGTTPSVHQILQTVKTDTFTLASATFTDVTGVSQAITPRSSANKVLVIVTGVAGIDDSNHLVRMNLLRDSTAIGQSTGSGSGNQTLGPYLADTSAGASFTICFLDSPATTSAVTYKIQVARSGGSGTVFVGRFPVNDNFRSITTITCIEVS